MSKYLRTGVTVTCPECGATGVPMGWGAGPDESVKLYRHPRGLVYRGGTRGLPRCEGPTDLFSVLLRGAGLAVGGDVRTPDDGMLF
ncbi:hypothetical protein [Williamsia deligens]|uniref:Uncharacterized protein n=1 Tax=Williamsia deligens TaxID=321325 RepID=A0ABW3GHH0_9NOCA|nr:hypothetical protein [Williamsia deligens]MCP2195620.1 hypothetical protein [Williamsia deligens]